LVNAFFLEKERALLSELPIHSAAFERESPDAELVTQANQFFLEVSSLYAFVVLNYLAVLKIMKKHGKHSVDKQRLRTTVFDCIFQQAFYLSLEHSYLFTEVRRLLQLRPMSMAAHLTRSPRNSREGWPMNGAPAHAAPWATPEQQQQQARTAQQSQQPQQQQQHPPQQQQHVSPPSAAPHALDPSPSPLPVRAPHSSPAVTPASTSPQQHSPSSLPRTWIAAWRRRSSVESNAESNLSNNTTNLADDSNLDSNLDSNTLEAPAHFELCLLNGMRYGDLDFSSLRNLDRTSDRDVEVHIERMLNMARVQHHLHSDATRVPVPCGPADHAAAAASSLPILGSPKGTTDAFGDGCCGTIPSHTPPAVSELHSRNGDLVGVGVAVGALRPASGRSHAQSIQWAAAAAPDTAWAVDGLGVSSTMGVEGTSVELKEQIHARLRQISRQEPEARTSKQLVRAAAPRARMLTGSVGLASPQGGETAETADDTAGEEDDSTPMRAPRHERGAETSDGELMFDISIE